MKFKKLKFKPQKSLVFSTLVLVVLLGALFLLYHAAHGKKTGTDNIKNTLRSGDYVEFETAVVLEILSDTCTADAVAEGAKRGIQSLTANILSGQYTGQTLLVSNTVGPVYGQALQPGDRFTAAVSTYADGTIRASVYEYDRSTGIYLLLGAFLLITVAVGGKTGAKSLVGLVLTVIALLGVLLPLLLAGWPVIPTTFLVCFLVTCISFVILGGICRKTICAAAGTVAGIALATLFGLLAQHLLRIDGYRQEYAEALLQLRQTGESTIGIRGLVVAGVIISALGAVMDVAMSISSAVQELAVVGDKLSARRLFASGMNIGRDMVGTMTNTLILAVIGSGLMLIVYIASLELPVRQFLSSPYLSLELISGLASSIGVILAVPLTAAISAFTYGHANHT